MDVTNNIGRDAKLPCFYCKTATYFPLAVWVKYGVWTGRRSGYGGEVLYLWMFGRSFRLHEFARWLS